MGCSSFNQGMTDEEGDVDSISSSSSEVSSVVSSESDMREEETSSASSSPTDQLPTCPLNDMSSLLQQLPFKRGLSKHYQGKSQSFTSLSNVRCLKDLAKPENPYNKKLKSCRSYGGLSESHRPISTHPSTNTCSRLISKKSSRGSYSPLSAKRINTNNGFLGNRPPIHPAHRSTATTTFSNQTPLFA